MLDTLYYDGKCPLCSHEIRLLERFKDSSLRLIDIHSLDFNSLDFSLEVNDPDTNNVDINNSQIQTVSAQTLLSILHLQTSEGNWVKGLDATVKAWSHTRFRVLFLPLRWPLIKQFSDWLYHKWASNRVCRINL